MFKYFIWGEYCTFCVNKHIISSNINEVIRSVLNFFFYDQILHAQKAPKSTKKHQKAQKALKAQKHNQTKAQKRKQANKN